MKRVLLLFPVLLSLLFISVRAEERKPVRFGLTAVVVRENLRFFDDMADYLSQKMGRPVKFVQRKSYREIMDMLESGKLEFAWICGYPFIQKRKPEYLKLLTVPIYKGAPFYRSYIIVHHDSSYKDIAELKGSVFAFSDPDSNSGFLYPQFFLTTRNFNFNQFFRQTFFTYNHAETVEAVAARVADGGAVDSYIWDFLKKTNPQIAQKTRVIHASSLFGFPPIVARKSVSVDLTKKMTRALTEMNKNPAGKQLLNTLHLDGFGQFSADIFDDIKVMAEKIKNRQITSSLDRLNGTAKP